MKFLERVSKKSISSIGALAADTLLNAAKEIAEEDFSPEDAGESRGEVFRRAVFAAVEEPLASREMMLFLETWMDLVFEQAWPVSPPGGCELLVATDLRTVEIRVAARSTLMFRLANRFVEACQCPDDKLFAKLLKLNEEIKAPEIVLWCRLKRIGLPQQSVDAGFYLHQHIQWILADIIVPQSPEQEIVQRYFLGERVEPAGYGCSLLPNEPESLLDFDIDEGAFKPSLFTCLLLLKQLGFSRPEDYVITLLSNAHAMSCGLLAGFGQKGLTRLSVILRQLHNQIAKELTETTGQEYLDIELTRLETIVGHAPDLLMYSAESSGYIVFIGYKL